MLLRKRRKYHLKLYCMFVTFSIWGSLWIISALGPGESVSIPNGMFHRRHFITLPMTRGLIPYLQNKTLSEVANNMEKGLKAHRNTPNGMEIDMKMRGEIANDLESNEGGIVDKLQQYSETDRMESNDTLHEHRSVFAYKREIFRDSRESKQNSVDCKKLMEGEEASLATARKIMKTQKRKAISLKSYTWIVDCDSFKKARGYILGIPAPYEKEFPLAFAIVAYRDVEQVERLLRAIYRPHNFYCLHVDIKTKQADFDAFNSISSCFDNVFLIKNPVNVTWGGFSVLEAELRCMKLLWQYKAWKYYINLTGQEFPLKTNLELVEILKAMKGANIADGTSLRGGNKDLFRWTLAGRRPPHNIKLVKGSVHVAVNRHFVHFCLHDNKSREFQEWLKKTEIPDETFFASLNHNPHLGIPGSFLGSYEESPSKPLFIRYKRWQADDNGSSTACRGKYVRGICVIGVGDLQYLAQHPGLFVNKLYLEYEYLALDCLEGVLLQRTYEQYEDGGTGIDVSFYQNIDQVKYQVKKRRQFVHGV